MGDGGMGDGGLWRGGRGGGSDVGWVMERGQRWSQ